VFTLTRLAAPWVSMTELLDSSLLVEGEFTRLLRLLWLLWFVAAASISTSIATAVPYCMCACITRIFSCLNASALLLVMILALFVGLALLLHSLSMPTLAPLLLLVLLGEFNDEREGEDCEDELLLLLLFLVVVFNLVCVSAAAARASAAAAKTCSGFTFLLFAPPLGCPEEDFELSFLGVGSGGDDAEEDIAAAVVVADVHAGRTMEAETDISELC